METKIDSVFISYRRITSQYPALLVYKDLKQHGYDPFIDYESIDSGKFADEILHQIASRSHFIVILSPGCLDRTVDFDDWLKKEILYAIARERNIVPLLFDKFEFKANQQYLQGELSPLSEFNALPVPEGYFDDAMRKLRERFLNQPVRGPIEPAPKADNQFVQKSLQKANLALEQEPFQSAFVKYSGRSQLFRSPTLKEILAFRSKWTFPANPATFDKLGRQPLPDEVILLEQNAIAYTDLGNPLGEEGNLIVTNKRLIFKPLNYGYLRFDILYESITLVRWGDIRDTKVALLTLQTRDHITKYSIQISGDQKEIVEKLIKTYL